jgi:hypothetical protein
MIPSLRPVPYRTIASGDGAADGRRQRAGLVVEGEALEDGVAINGHRACVGDPGGALILEVTNLSPVASLAGTGESPSAAVGSHGSSLVAWRTEGSNVQSGRRDDVVDPQILDGTCARWRPCHACCGSSSTRSTSASPGSASARTGAAFRARSASTRVAGSPTMSAHTPSIDSARHETPAPDRPART